MKTVYGYVRVSDMKQVDGASLTEQERAITDYAKKNNLNIVEWFRETKTAAKRGRPHFERMLKQLKQGKANGAIIHKIDRSARNLHDWAAIGDLIDNKIEVHFAHESLDMTERGGRLSADIQAVMASDYVRNLRQEAIKGLYGRLKQGLWPFRAPIGYNDTGRGQIKTINLENAKFIQTLFELYVFHNHSIQTLVKKMAELGLRNHNGKKHCKNGISRLLNNPFYTGVMKVRGSIYKGVHKPIITTRLFNQAQLKLNNKHRNSGLIHNYLFKGIIRCHLCNRLMTGEKQKGMVYYRCSVKDCNTKSIREDFAEELIHQSLQNISAPQQVVDILNDEEKHLIEENQKDKKSSIKSLKLQVDNLQAQEKRLLQCYLEGILLKNEYVEEKNILKIKIDEKTGLISSISDRLSDSWETSRKVLELCKSLYNIYDSANFLEKQHLIKIVFSNFRISGKKAIITCFSPYLELANCTVLSSCRQSRDGKRMIYTDKSDPFFRDNPFAFVYHFKTNTTPLVVEPPTIETMRLFLKDCKRHYLEGDLSLSPKPGDGLLPLD